MMYFETTSPEQLANVSVWSLECRVEVGGNVKCTFQKIRKMNARLSMLGQTISENIHEVEVLRIHRSSAGKLIICVKKVSMVKDSELSV